MKNLSILIISLLVAILFFACNNNTKKQNETITDTVITKTMDNKENLKIKAKFDAVYTNSNGAIFSFIDLNGNVYEFWEVGEVPPGMEFTKSLKPNIHEVEFDKIIFEVEYTSSKKEFYNASTSKNELKEVLVIVKVSKVNDNNTTQFLTVDQLKNTSLVGTEPFWNITFKDTYAEYSSPEFTEPQKIFYMKNDSDKSKPNINELILNSENEKVTILGDMSNKKVKILIFKQNCSDGMSDESYPYTANVIVEKSQLSGCGILKK